MDTISLEHEALDLTIDDDDKLVHIVYDWPDGTPNDIALCGYKTTKDVPYETEENCIVCIELEKSLYLCE